MVVDSLAPSPDAEYATLISPFANKASLSSYCLKYSLFMFGDNVGSLSVILKIGTGGMIRLAYHSEPLGYDWTSQAIDLGFPSTSSVQVNIFSFHIKKNLK